MTLQELANLEGVSKQAIWERTAKGRAYRKSDKYKAYQKAYQKSDAYKACQKAYRKSDAYKAYQRAYQKSDKYKAYQKAYQNARYANDPVYQEKRKKKTRDYYKNKKNL
jgi:hypothetical protein